MKNVCFVMALVMLVGTPLLSWAAEDGAALFKSKCVACHGDEGQGKPAMKMPAVKGTEMTADKMVEYLTKGVEGKKFPHKSPVAGINEEQAKAIVDFVKNLK
jgi:mono/diheme cytochrome c family protein